MQIPLDERVSTLTDIPYTLSYTIRKRIQIDNLNELPEEKRPPEKMIWDGSSEDIDDWLDRVVKKKEPTTLDFAIGIGEVEG